MAENTEKRRGSIRSLFTINIGTIIFGAILVYILISIFIYATTKHVTTYQVTSGPLAQNQTYTAVALRTETLVTTNGEGYVNYYAQEGKKVRKNGIVYSLSPNTPETTGTTELSDESLSKIRTSVARFAGSFDPSNFNDVYTFKYSLSGDILNYAGLDGTAATASIGTESVYMSDESGVIIYGTDGYEDVAADTFDASVFNQSAYQYTDLKSAEKVSVGDTIYKIITDDRWSIVLPLTSFQATKLESYETIRVKFLKDDASMTGSLYILTRDNVSYAVISFTTGMVRYASERFLDVELVTNSQTGLKIPLSAITTKEFYTIPKDFAVEVENSSEIGFLRQVTDSDGNATSEFINATIYASDDDSYFVDKEEFSDGDILIKEDSISTYTVEDVTALEGVYCINKGYAVFRRIEPIENNDEYCIVKTGTTYGLSLYDNIVLDSSTVREEEILY